MTYVSIPGMATFLVLNRSDQNQSQPSNRIALACLRILLGSNLIYLGLTKWLWPTLFIAVIQNYPQVFQKPVPFLSIENIALLAGSIEILLGLFLIIGFYVRSASTGILLIFGLITLQIPSEFLGHLPILGSALYLLKVGSQKNFPKSQVRPSRNLSHLPLSIQAKPQISHQSMKVHTVIAWIGFTSLVGFLHAHSPLAVPATPWSQTNWHVEGAQDRIRFEIQFVEAAAQGDSGFQLLVQVAALKDSLNSTSLDLRISITDPAQGRGLLELPRTRHLSPTYFAVDSCRLPGPGNWQIDLYILREDRLVDQVCLPIPPRFSTFPA